MHNLTAGKRESLRPGTKTLVRASIDNLALQNNCYEGYLFFTSQPKKADGVLWVGGQFKILWTP